MKKKLKSILYPVITIVILFCVVQYLGWVMRPIDLDIAVDAVDVFHELPKNSIDVLCLGSSHMWRGLDPVTIYREQNLSAYNYGCVYQKINTTLLFLQDAFRTQSPRVVVIDSFYANRLNTNNTMTNELYSTRHLPFSKAKMSYLYSLFGLDLEQYAAYFFPLAAFHSNWEALFSPENKQTITYKDLHETFGFAYSDSVVPSSFPSSSAKEQLPLDIDSIKVLDEIVTLCNTHNAQLVFITIPYEYEYKYANAMRDYAANNHCYYLNLFDHLQETDLNAATDFSDTSHLNVSGATKVASFVGKYIADVVFTDTDT